MKIESIHRGARYMPTNACIVMVFLFLSSCSHEQTIATPPDAGGDTDTDTDTAPYCDVHDCWLTEPTNQTICYDELAEMTCTSFPCNAEGSPDFCGQDAQYPDNTRTFTCYDEFGAIQDPCDGTGAGPDETVVDSLTGLEWQRTWGTDMEWQETIDYCDGLDYGGHTDWRLPSWHELAGIVDYGQHGPAIDTVAFPGTPAGVFSSSSSNDGYPGEAWFVDFLYGWACKDIETLNSHARCVRGEPYHGTSPVRFQVSGDAGQEVVLDQAAGLEWQKEYVVKTWREALQYCEGLDYGGHDDWRLPNANELRGLVDIEMYDPASDFPGIPLSPFWSSSSLVNHTEHAIAVSFDYGFVNGGAKTVQCGTRCVRGGP